MAHPSVSDIAWRHVSRVPFYRAILRTFEDYLFQQVDMPRPILDLGCGDGQFSAAVFENPLHTGIDPDFKALREARVARTYQFLVCSDGANIPFPSGWFGSAFSNSTLEHIPKVEPVLAELARVIRPGGMLIITIPNQRFERELLGVSLLMRLRLTRFAEKYADMFNQVSKHIHLDPPGTWVTRLNAAGFLVKDCWNYFPPQALRWMEIGHLGGPWAYLVKKITGRWVLIPHPYNLGFATRIIQRYLSQPTDIDGTCSFIVSIRT